MAVRKRKKRRTKKKATTTKSKSTGRQAKQVDYTKDPLWGLKPGDLILYTPIYGDGEVQPEEVHLIIEHTYERDPETAGSFPTVKLTDDKLYSDTLFFFGPGTCELEVLTDTHKLELEAVGGEVKWKLSKKRKSRKAA